MRIRFPLVLVGLLAAPVLCASAQDYALPPEPLHRLAMAAPAPGIQLSPDARWMLLSERRAMPSLGEVARPMLRLAGRRLDPAAHAAFASSSIHGLSLRGLTNDNPRNIPLAEGARVTWVSWAPTSEAVAYVVESAAGSELWVFGVSEPKKPRLLTKELTTVPGPPRWSRDGSAMLVHLWPGGPEPEAKALPKGPTVLETDGRKTPLRTYQDLLEDSNDASLWAYHSASQVAWMPVDGSEPKILADGLFAAADLSPDDRFLLLEEYTRPFSFTQPASHFGRQVILVDRQDPQRELPAWDLPLLSAVPIGGVPTGPRLFRWAASHPASLVWLEALDGGDPKQEALSRDRWMMLQGPFEPTQSEPDSLTWLPTELLRTQHRARGLEWFADPTRVLATEYDRDRRWVRATLHGVGVEATPVVLEDRSARDAYADPGRTLRTVGPYGRSVAQVERGHMLRSGRGSSDAGDLPFLDRQDLSDGTTSRVWRTEKGSYESVLHAIYVSDPGGTGKLRFITRHEDPTSPPNLRLREEGSDDFLPVTEFEDSTPELRGITKAIVRYERADGVPLSATLYLPEDHQPGERLPLIVWGYPLEYGDVATAGQLRGSQARYTRPRGASHLLLTTLGYAVLDGATMPVVGDPETMNDTFVEQLVASAEAAVSFAVEAGFADRDRVAVAGHSYGAFMAANLLAHSDLFRTAIARSGAYNRTLTPFGFQSERRNLWEAQDTYVRVSPFLAADRIDEPLLLIHGVADNNSGTFPLQSERLFQAIQGLGGEARLVLLPGEGHGYRAEESVLHVLAEMAAWLDEHLAPRAPVEGRTQPVEAVAPRDQK